MKQIDLQPTNDRLGTEDKLKAIWREILNIENIDVHDDFFDLGGDSSLAVLMFAAIHKSFNVKLPLALLYEAPTIEQLAGIVRDGTSTGGWSPLVAIQPVGSRPPLFCFHGAGGNVLIYRDLARRLGADQPLYGLQAQGMDGSQPPLTTVEEMAGLYVREIQKNQPNGPYHLAGYCGGGTIAYEAAQQLRAKGEAVALLALFDTMNWSKVPITLWSKASYTFQQLLFHLGSFFSLRPAGMLEYYREKSKVLRSRVPVWRGMLLARLRQAPTEASSTEFVLGNIWQINDRACWRYVPKPYAGVLTDFRPSAQYKVFSNPDLKWEQLAVGGVAVITLPVYPASMLVEPFVGHLADALAKSIEKTMQASEKAAQPDYARL